MDLLIKSKKKAIICYKNTDMNQCRSITINYGKIHMANGHIDFILPFKAEIVELDKSYYYIYIFI